MIEQEPSSVQQAPLGHAVAHEPADQAPPWVVQAPCVMLEQVASGLQQRPAGGQAPHRLLGPPQAPPRVVHCVEV
jgi:hypothetical protein